MDLEDDGRTEKNAFKNPYWHERKKLLKQSRNQRLNKNLKQICTNELLSRNRFNYMSIEGPPPLKPPKCYCDVTGYETKYKDKSTGLYYHDKYIYQYIKTLNKPSIDQYLSIRKVAN